MANDCLVTKLKGEVQNDNLPTLNKLFISKIPYSFDNDMFWCIRTGDKSVTIKSKVKYHFGGVQGEYTETTIPSNTCWAGIYNSADVSESIDDFIEISSLYNCKIVGLYRGVNTNPISPIKFKLNSGVQSLKYANIEALTIDEENIFDFPNSLRYVHIQCPIGTGNKVRDIESILRLPNIDYINMSVNDANYDARIDLSKNYNSSPVVVLNARPIGPVTNLPINLEFINVASSGDGVTGSIEDWVAHMRLSGRTTGGCQLVGADTCDTLTYTINGQTKTLRKCAQDGDIFIGETTAILSWNTDTITFISSSSNLRKIENVYNWNFRMHP